MDNEKFNAVYQRLEQELRDECNELVRSGQMSQEDADFKFWMVRDEILESLIVLSE